MPSTPTAEALKRRNELTADKEPNFTVFTKPWRNESLDELGALVSNLGFGGVELPVREGYQVNPEEIGRDLPKAARSLERHGLVIGSVATEVNERAISACGDAGVPIIRTMASIDMAVGYRATEEKIRRQWDALVPALERSGVKIGIQNHYGMMVGSAVGIMHLIEGYDPRQIGAVLDTAHCGLDGEPDVMAIDIVWSHLLLVNLKSSFWVRETGPEHDQVKWRAYWSNGHQGLTSWSTVASELLRRGYRGDVCLPAEYSDPYGDGQKMGEAVNPLIRADLAYAKSLFGAN